MRAVDIQNYGAVQYQSLINRKNTISIRNYGHDNDASFTAGRSSSSSNSDWIATFTYVKMEKKFKRNFYGGSGTNSHAFTPLRFCPSTSATSVNRVKTISKPPRSPLSVVKHFIHSPSVPSCNFLQLRTSARRVNAESRRPPSVSA